MPSHLFIKLTLVNPARGPCAGRRSGTTQRTRSPQAGARPPRHELAARRAAEALVAHARAEHAASVGRAAGEACDGSGRPRGAASLGRGELAVVAVPAHLARALARVAPAHCRAVGGAAWAQLGAVRATEAVLTRAGESAQAKAPPAAAKRAAHGGRLVRVSPARTKKPNTTQLSCSV